MGQGLHREGSSSSGSSSSIGGGATDSRVPGTGWASGGPACGLGTRLYNLRASFAVAEPCMPGCTLPCHMHTHTHTITPGLHVDPDITHTHFPLSLQCYLCHHIPQRDSSPCGLHGTQIRDVQMILRMQDQSCLWNVVWRVDDVEGPPIRSAPLGVWRRLQVKINIHTCSSRTCRGYVGRTPASDDSQIYQLRGHPREQQSSTSRSSA